MGSLSFTTHQTRYLITASCAVRKSFPLSHVVLIGEDKKAKALLSRSLQSLSRHKHIEVISKYAIAEFEFGSCDRARVLFEELLSAHPKRTDLWHIYVDREIKLGKYQEARSLFDRLVASKLSARNMKAVFKKYLAFESKHGTLEDQERVKLAAQQYVERMM